MSAIEELFESLDRRWRPEDVAARVALVLPDQSEEEREVLSRLTRWSRRYSSMPADFARVAGMGRPLRTAAALSGIAAPEDDLDLLGLAAFLEEFEARIGKQVGRSDFKEDRLNREQRRAVGLGELSRRRYNKLFRLAARLERKRDKAGVELEKRELTQVSKSRLAAKVPREEFLEDPATACFVAYYAATCNRRSVFTNQSQARAFDELCELLFRRLVAAPDLTRWYPVAMVHPVREVLARLTEEERGRLLGLWHQILTRLAGLLEATWTANDISRETMIVRRGNDSSTWNVLAGAWNKARDAYFALLYEMHMEGLLGHQCVGKVLRLMAADVAAWHRSSGGDLDPNTAVWNDLPLPWEVFSGRAVCTLADVAAACSRRGLDPHATGWAGPRPPGKPQPLAPTADLVHGIAVASPELAETLRRLGVFSGKAGRGDIAEFVPVIDEVRAAHIEAQGPLAKGASGLDPAGGPR